MRTWGSLLLNKLLLISFFPLSVSVDNGRVLMTTDEGGERESPDDDKAVLGKRHVENGFVKVGADDEDKLGELNKFQGSGTMQVKQQQQPLSSVVHWERFLHVRTIRVLLVENDDCTRHVVTALLRNCNYEVVVAANGLQAWRILEDLANHVDIVLTEVVMPGLSGIALLSRIMSHKTRKIIPVIMMSSHDSVGVVFKCLSKGAVDFLVKPIRKNELKNLWQHVWRRCHSSSGSGSESGTQTQKSVKSRSSEKAENSGGDGGENNGSNGLNVDDTSDDGSGAQSSWTKQAVENDSSKELSPVDQVAERPDSTCAQVIRPNPENSVEKRLDMSVVREVHEQSQPDNVAKGNDVERTRPKSMGSNSENMIEIPATRTASKLKSVPESNIDMTIKHVENGQVKSSAEWTNMQKGVIAKMAPLIDGRESGCIREGTIMLDIKSISADDSRELNLELSLKRLRGTQHDGRFSQDDRCVLRRSEQSAFTRYNTSSNTPKLAMGSSSKIRNSVEGAKLGSLSDPQAHSMENIANHSSNEVSNIFDMGSTTDKHLKLPTIAKDISEATSAINSMHPSAFRPVKDDPRYVKPHAGLAVPKEKQTTTTARGSHQEHQIQRSNCYRHHFHNMDQHPSNEMELSQKKIASDPPQCGSLIISTAPVDGNPGNYSLNRSASGSNHLSNGHNGSSTLVNTVGTKTETDCGQAAKSGSGGDASGSGSGTGIDDKKLTQREAALYKFRQKRKERCFIKKVRYQNRKKLAESRPRVRGQFVKQVGPDSSSRSTDD